MNDLTISGILILTGVPFALLAPKAHQPWETALLLLAYLSLSTLLLLALKHNRATYN